MTFVIARAAALVLHFEVALILLPVCRNLISLLRISPLGDVLPFDKKYARAAPALSRSHLQI